MKLHDKKRINETHALQQKEQIDEGVRIARKVDVLREELASLELQHQNFIAGAKGELAKAIGGLLETKTSLENQIESKKEELRILRQPLDDEWATVREEKSNLSKEKEILDAEKNDLSQKQEATIEEEKRIAREREALEDTKRDTDRLNENARTARQDAERIKDEATRERELQTEQFSKANTVLANAQEENERVAQNNARVQESQDLREKRLDDKERAINDKYQTLLRTIELTKHE